VETMTLKRDLQRPGWPYAAAVQEGDIPPVVVRAERRAAGRQTHCGPSAGLRSGRTSTMETQWSSRSELLAAPPSALSLG
jgi:hypothetical protein